MPLPHNAPPPVHPWGLPALPRPPSDVEPGGFAPLLLGYKSKAGIRGPPSPQGSCPPTPPPLDPPPPPLQYKAE